MDKKGGEGAEKGFSARQLVMVFLAAAAVCGVFFSLGFLVGFNERSSGAAPLSEQVMPPRVIPPTVNPLLETSPPGPKGPATGHASTGQTADATERQISPEAIPEPKPAAPPASSAAGSAPEVSLSGSGGGTGASLSATPGEEVGTGFTIQVAATTTKQDADAVVERLGARGYPVFIVTPEYAHANDNLFRVQVGPYTSRDRAEKVRQKLAQEGFKNPFIKR